MNGPSLDVCRSRRPAAPRLPVRPGAAREAAFAALTDEDLSLDGGERPAERRVAPELIDSLRSQLAAIESQRGTLQRLLDGLDG